MRTVTKHFVFLGLTFFTIQYADLIVLNHLRSFTPQHNCEAMPLHRREMDGGGAHLFGFKIF